MDLRVGAMTIKLSFSIGDSRAVVMIALAPRASVTLTTSNNVFISLLHLMQNFGR
jgi:hypothetical protein